MVNRVYLIGRLGADPEVRTFDDGGKVVNLNVATWRSWKDRSDEWQTFTEWHRVVLKGKAAEYCPDVRKGDIVTVKGEIRQREYVDRNEIKRYINEIIGKVKAIPKPKQVFNYSPEKGENITSASSSNPQPGNINEMPEDDLPF